MNLRFGILTPNPFPIGNVATNRFSTYAKAIAENGVYVKVYVLKGTEIENSINNIHPNGVICGIEYQYMAKSTIWNTEWNVFYKLFKYLYGIILCIINLRRNKVNSIILYTEDPFYMFIFGIYSKMFGVTYLIDKSEYPKFYGKRGSSFFSKLYLKLFQFFDGIIVMTKELELFYSKVLNNNSTCIYFPMTVDLSRFEQIEMNKHPCEPYIACVFGVHNRDCILDTIKSFLLFKDKYGINVKLKLIGDFENLFDKDSITSFLDFNNSRYISDILFTGPISSTLMPSFLTNAKCLITTPKEYISGGFPTKLGEYLATGKPVLANDVGEISSFLKHGESAFLARPGDIEGIANNMYSIFSNPLRSKLIGIRGKKVAKDCFNANVYINLLFKVSTL